MSADEGRRLFNEGRFFEAHEAFEDAWREASGRRKTALQALTQLAAAFHKLKEFGTQARGAAYLLEKCAEKLEADGALLGPLGASALAGANAARAELSAGRAPAPPAL